MTYWNYDDRILFIVLATLGDRLPRTGGGTTKREKLILYAVPLTLILNKVSVSETAISSNFAV